MAKGKRTMEECVSREGGGGEEKERDYKLRK